MALPLARAARAALVLAPLTALLLAGGCEVDDVEEQESDIIGGVDATSAKLDAIGSVGHKGWDGEGRLLLHRDAHRAQGRAHREALRDSTAPARSPKLASEDDVYFAVGRDVARSPQAARQAVKSVLPPRSTTAAWSSSAATSPCTSSKSRSTDVTPMPWAIAGTSRPTKVGKKLTAVGYGVQDRDRTSGHAQGRARSRSRPSKGQPMHALFPTKEAFTTRT
jgi:hypothetical protein